jgi:hypothetical protein
MVPAETGLRREAPSGRYALPRIWSPVLPLRCHKRPNSEEKWENKPTLLLIPTEAGQAFRDEVGHPLGGGERSAA